MIISINWLKKFNTIDLPVDELATLIGARLVEIEEVIDLGAKYKDVLVARVMASDKHEDSDHLNVVKLDDGGVAQGVERDENGYVQVVCGAPNMRAGLLVAWLPPGATVPETFGTAEPFVLDARKLRGVMSSGMIASARELALFDDHEGILELDKDLVPGSRFAEGYELDDYLLDIENKSLTHRPDTFGIIGFAREVAAIQGGAFTTPDWLREITPQLGEATDMQAPTVTIDDPELSARYQAIVLSGADGQAQSPLQIQTYLARVGVRPISAVVDATNYLMMLTGQPLHAFDYDKLVAVGGGRADIHVRAGRENETLKLLDGRIITLTPGDIVIAAGETAVALAGAMGGADTEIDATTKNIIVEAATFNLYNLRATQMRHGIFSEAITRFTKGQPAELTAPVLANAVKLMADWAGAKAVTTVSEAYPGKRDILPIDLSIANVNATLGSLFTAEAIATTLKNVEFGVSENGEAMAVTHPYWRADIHIPEDVMEEIGRLNGFDEIEPMLPLRDFTAVRPTDFDTLRTNIRRVLVRAGANELLTYSFVHGDMLQKAGQKLEDSYRLTNSISPDLQYYRQSLTPSLLAHVHANQKQGFDDFALFELNKTHPKQHGLTHENVPVEVDMLALTVARKKATGAPYYQAKKMLDYLAEMLGLQLIYTPFESDPNYPVAAPFEYRRSAIVADKASGTMLGIVGEYKKSVSRAFKLPDYAAGFELNTTELLKVVSQLVSSYAPLSRYPGTERDMCFQVAADVTYAQITDVIAEVLAGIALETSVSPVDIYQPEGDVEKRVTIRIKLTSHEKTLTSDEVNAVVQQVADAVAARTNAVVI